MGAVRTITHSVRRLPLCPYWRTPMPPQGSLAHPTMHKTAAASDAAPPRERGMRMTMERRDFLTASLVGLGGIVFASDLITE